MPRRTAARPHNPYAVAAAAAGSIKRAELNDAFDALFPKSRPTPAQQAIFNGIGIYPHRYVVAGNQSGKTALAAREIVWILKGNHPHGWKRPATWGEGPLTIIIAGQSRTMMEVEIWDKKLKPFFEEGEWHETRVGGALTMLTHNVLGHRIVLISHADSSEKNRKYMQGFVAHYVWLDEMPSSVVILNELQERVTARRGYFIATFTPKFRNDKIKKIVDSVPEIIGKRYRLSKLDNPLYADRREEILASLEGHSQAFIDSVLYGEWMVGDDMVYQWDEDLYGGEPPESYSAQGWRHVAVADPATESKLGLTLWAEDPETNLWWCVLAEYVEKIHVPSKIVAEVERRIAGRNIMRRVCDSHEAWFINQARETCGVRWHAIEGKTAPAAKMNYIKDFQQAFGGQIRIAHWCTPLTDEIKSCERNPETGVIKNKSKFHLVDTGHYFVATMPKADPKARSTTVTEKIREHIAYEEKKRARREAQAEARERNPRARPLAPAQPQSPLPYVPPLAPMRVRQRGAWRARRG